MTMSMIEAAALRAEVQRLTEQLEATRAELDLVTQERDNEHLMVEELERVNARLSYRLDIAHGAGGK